MFSDSEKSEYVKSFSKIGEFVGLVMVSWFCGGRPSVAVPKGTVEAGAVEEMLKKADAAKFLKVSENTFSKFEKQGLIKRVPKLGERTVRYRKFDVEKLASRKRE